MWRIKANAIIGTVCYWSYLEANTKKDGTPYKRHRPYHVPALAEDLVECLGDNDEERAKAIFTGTMPCL